MVYKKEKWPILTNQPPSDIQIVHSNLWAHTGLNRKPMNYESIALTS